MGGAAMASEYGSRSLRRLLSFCCFIGSFAASGAGAATAPPGQKTVAEPIGHVTYTLGDEKDYAVNIAGEDLILLSFEDFPCLKAPKANSRGFSVLIEQDGTKAVLRMKAPREVGHVTTLPIVCAYGIGIPLRIKVTHPPRATTAMTIKWPTSEKQARMAAITSARMNEKQECDQLRAKDAVLHTERTMQFVLEALAKGDIVEERSKSARSEDRKLVAYVTSVRRLGDYGILNFTLENLYDEDHVTQVGEVEVSAVGADFVESRPVASSRNDREAELHLTETNATAKASAMTDIRNTTKKERLDGAPATPTASLPSAPEKGRAPMTVLLSGTSIKAGETIDGSVMFPFPWPRTEMGSVTLVVRGTETGIEATIRNIAFPRGKHDA